MKILKTKLTSPDGAEVTIEWSTTEQLRQEIKRLGITKKWVINIPTTKESIEGSAIFLAVV